ncbi:hypothetical protein N9B76_01735, partial [Candidatus Thioglobus sp.]|nr:hypothetical protein [Candidatus Thioglobus sp.]
MGGADVSGLAATAMKTSQLYSNTYSRDLLIILMAVHILGTIIAYTIYINLASGLGDSYVTADFGGFKGEFDRTLLVQGIYAYMRSFLPGFLAPMALGLLVAILIWNTFRDVYAQTNRLLFWTCNLFPHFLVWSGSSSKEQIVIICGLIIINFAAKRSFAAGRLNLNLIFVFAALWVTFIIRPNYFLIYLMIFITAFLSPWLDKTITKRFSVGIWVIAFVFAIAVLIFVLSINTRVFSEEVVIFMNRVEVTFLSYEAGSNRTNIQWNDIWDFLYNSLWAIPQG